MNLSDCVREVREHREHRELLELRELRVRSKKKFSQNIAKFSRSISANNAQHRSTGWLFELYHQLNMIIGYRKPQSWGDDCAIYDYADTRSEACELHNILCGI